MIIVLLFILVYCCWGTFSCARQEDTTASTEEGTGPLAHAPGIQVVQGSHMVIVPISNMIYVGDPESRRIYQIPMEQDKPPAYTEVDSGRPPPPYVVDTSAPDATPDGDSSQPETTDGLPELPPSYENCLSDPSPEVQMSDGDQRRDSKPEHLDPDEQMDDAKDTSDSSQDASITLPLADDGQRATTIEDVRRNLGVILRPGDLIPANASTVPHEPDAKNIS